MEEAGGAPGPCGRVVEFSRCVKAGPRNIACGNQNFAVGQERCRMIVATQIRLASITPSAGGGIVEFSVIATDEVPVPHNEHLAVGQECRRVKSAGRFEIAREGPGACGWVVQFSTSERGGA